MSDEHLHRAKGPQLQACVRQASRPAQWLVSLAAGVLSVGSAASPAAGVVVVGASAQVDGVLIPGGDAADVFRISFTNTGAQVETLLAITFTNSTIGPGSATDLDRSWSSIVLLRDDNSAQLASGAFAAGKLTFSNLSVAVQPSNTVWLRVRGGASLTARDSDRLDFRLAAAADLMWGGGSIAGGTWPLDPAGSWQVDGMSANQIVLHAIPTDNLVQSSTNNVVMDVTLPANGYETDTLHKLNVANLGTAEAALVIEAVRAWADNGDGAFDALTDRLLGTLVFTGNRWELTAVSETVPVAGLRIVITIDVTEDAPVGSTVRMAFVQASDLVIGMESGNDGPVDRSVEYPTGRPISDADRITFTTAPVQPGVVAPGTNDVVLMHLLAANTNGEQNTLTAIEVINKTQAAGPASTADLDGDVRVLELRMDGNDDGMLGDIATDPLLGTALFENGAAAFRGITWTLPPGTARHMFITGDVSLDQAADGDVLAVEIADVLAVSFASPTTIAANWPLDSGARWIVDGMVAAQIQQRQTPAMTLAPNDGPIVAFDATIPANGYATDVLQGIEVVNQGSAIASDIAVMRLWRDGGNGAFDAGSGDDIDLGPMVPLGGRWKSTQLTVPLTVGGVGIFVSCTIAGAPTDAATIQLALPIGGVIVASGNDGPRDALVANNEALLLSSAPVLATLALDREVTVVGQAVTLRVIVRNVSTETIQNVAPAFISQAGSGGLTLVGGPAPAALDLVPGAIDTLIVNYQSASVGTVRVSSEVEGTGATSSLLRRSPRATSSLLRVLLQTSQLGLLSLGNMPFSISRGQPNILPLNLTFSLGGGINASQVAVRTLRLRFEDAAGAAIVPNQLVTRVVVGEGTTTYFETTNIPSGLVMDLALAPQIIVRGTEPTTVGIRLDVSSVTTVPQFRISIVQATWFTAQDVTSGSPTPVVLQQGTFPVRSGLGQLLEAPTQVDVIGLPASDAAAAPGQAGVTLLRFRLQSLGLDNVTSAARVGAIGLELVDANGIPVPANTVLQRLRVMRGAELFAEQALAAFDSTTVPVPLWRPVDLPVNQSRDLEIQVDLRENATLGSYVLRLSQPIDVVAEDANRGASLAVLFAQQPLQGGVLTVQSRVDHMFVRGTARLPARTNLGERNRAAMGITLRHPGPAGAGRIRLSALTVRCRNEARAPLTPEQFVDAVRVLSGAQEVGALAQPPETGSSLVIPLSGVELVAGETVDLELRVDFEATAPVSFLELVVDASGIAAHDANVATAVSVVADTAGELPLSSGVTKLELPPRELLTEIVSRMPAVLAADGASRLVALLSLTNPDASGAIRVDHVVVRSADRDRVPVPIGAVAERVEVYRGGSLWAASDSLGFDSLTALVTFQDSVDIDSSAPAVLDVRVVFRAATSVKSFRVGVVADDIGVVQPPSVLLAIRVEAAQGSTFPLWTEPGSFTSLALNDSYANFPNPFAAGREKTTFAYYLRDAANVSIRLLTPHGRTIRQLLREEPRHAGLHQSDAWNGKNGLGVTVVNGVYLAELTVRYEDGSVERVLRKVAVAR